MVACAMHWINLLQLRAFLFAKQKCPANGVASLTGPVCGGGTKGGPEMF
jgi:hypothetical protein